MSSSGGGLRRRHVGGGGSDSLGGLSDDGPSLVRQLKRLDIYPKMEEEFTVKTQAGGMVSVVTVIIALLFLWSELQTYSRPIHVEHVKVDTTNHDDSLKINLNITFPRISCGGVMVDVMDIAGQQQVNVQKSIIKQRLDRNTGAFIGGQYIDLHVVDPHAAMRQAQQGQGQAGSHAGGGGGGHHHHHGHNHAHRRLLTLLSDEVIAGVEKVEADPSKEGEGCMIAGTLRVNRVAGNFHVALGASHRSGGRHIHHFMLSDLHRFNTSHVINHLSFGDDVPTSPLDGVSRFLDKGTAHFQYFIKVVPTTFIDSATGEKTLTNQYSVTQQMKEIPLDADSMAFAKKIPGVFFLYDISPFRVTVTEESRSFTEFLVSICAILGGIVTIAGLVDSVLFHTNRIVQEQSLDSLQEASSALMSTIQSAALQPQTPPVSASASSSSSASASSASYSVQKPLQPSTMTPSTVSSAASTAVSAAASTAASAASTISKSIRRPAKTNID
eukprot:TRINITY_DN66286_c6_g4_i1.p1 TRINITY_DN66286_c6_g4~~TRINITY_DN66286_c6_g4_i1.p1  ORF type:complete len:498 (+),score=264.47 TRINITY_DN66286_c6_g4_i1:28-1521(+)